jgi:acyl carrier protein
MMFPEVKGTVSIRSTILSEIQALAKAEQKPLPELRDDLPLLESGLDSLMLAILVARLEEALGLDPFTDSEDVFYPVTLGDFIKAYETAGNSR